LLKPKTKAYSPVTNLENKFQLNALTENISQDKKLTFTLISYLTVLTIFANLNFVNSPLIGAAAFLTFFLINGTFLAYSLFEKETNFSKFMLGQLLLVVLLGFVGWLTMIFYNLDVPRTTIAILIVATITSLVNRARLKSRQKPETPKTENQSKTPPLIYIIHVIYLFSIGLAFLLLFISRTGQYFFLQLFSYLQ